MNMSYYRFQNTAIDLQDCLNHIFDDDLSPKEQRAKRKLIRLCQEIVFATKDDNKGELNDVS